MSDTIAAFVSLLFIFLAAWGAGELVLRALEAVQ